MRKLYCQCRYGHIFEGTHCPYDGQEAPNVSLALELLATNSNITLDEMRAAGVPEVMLERLVLIDTSSPDFQFEALDSRSLVQDGAIQLVDDYGQLTPYRKIVIGMDTVPRSFVTTICFGFMLLIFGLFVMPVIPYAQLDAVLTGDELRDPNIRDRTLALLQKPAALMSWVCSVAGLICMSIGFLGWRSVARIESAKEE